MYDGNDSRYDILRLAKSLKILLKKSQRDKYFDQMYILWDC